MKIIFFKKRHHQNIKKHLRYQWDKGKPAAGENFWYIIQENH